VITWIEGEDPQMMAAIQRAQATLPAFEAELGMDSRRVIPALEAAIVKAFFPDPSKSERGEHMWLDDVQIDLHGVAGRLSEDPHFVHGLRAGQPVVVPPDRVSDWVLFFGLKQKLVSPPAKGGFTLGVIWQQMSEQERSELASQAPFCWFIDSGTSFGAL